MNKRNTIIALVVGTILIIFIIGLFIRLLPLIILLAVAYWVYKKIKPDKPKNYSENNGKKREDFKFIDVDYKDTDKK